MGAALGEAAFAAVPRREERQVCLLPPWEPWAAGRAMSLDEAVCVALEENEIPTSGRQTGILISLRFASGCAGHIEILPTTGLAEERYELFGDDFRACATTMGGRGPSMRKSNLSPRVVMFERHPHVGGAAVTEELWPGFRFSTCAHMVHAIHPRIIRDLRLRERGFEVLSRGPWRRFQPNGTYFGAADLRRTPSAPRRSPLWLVHSLNGSDGIEATLFRGNSGPHSQHLAKRREPLWCQPPHPQ